MTLMYNIGDMVLYGGEGICSIIGIEDKRIADKKISYYILSPGKGTNSVFYVPVEGKTAETKLRKIITAADFSSIVKEAKPSEWIENDRARRDKYKAAINEADRSSLVSFVKSVKLHKDHLADMGKKLHKLDEYFLVEVEDLLIGELQTIFKIDKGEVISFMLGELEPEAI